MRGRAAVGRLAVLGCAGVLLGAAVSGHGDGRSLAGARPVAAIVADPTVVAAGDIGCDPSDPAFTGANPSACQMRATADLAVSLAPRYVLPVGDTQYLENQVQGNEPSLDAYRAGYGGSWGTIPTRVAGAVVRPVPGNHEYGDMREDSSPPLTAAANYYSYFGPAGLNVLPESVTGPSNDWYSFDIPVNGGSWHVVALDSECAVLPSGGAADGCATGSPMETWLAQDLAAHQGQCTLAYWHTPRWAWGSSGNDARVDALWRDLARYKVTAAVHGHDHFYERSAPMDADGNPAAGGVVQFIAGTGGVDHEATGGFPAPSTVVAQNGTDFGVLALTLHASSLDFAFKTTAGTTPDSGTIACPTSTASPAPLVSAVSPVSGPAGGGTTVTISGSGFAPGAGVTFGNVAATNVNVVSPTTITAEAPAGTTTVDVRVSTAAGTSPVDVRDEYTYTFSSSSYTASLRASSTAPAVGGSVKLTASSSRRLSPSAGLAIVDVSTGTVLKRVTSGTSFSTSVSQAVASIHRYVARIDNGTTVYSVSAPAVVTWGTPAATTTSTSTTSTSTTPTTSTSTTSTTQPAGTGPVVTGVSPPSGPAAGGTVVTVTGSGFTAATTVSFGAKAATNVTVTSPTSLTATAPADTRTVDVTVTTTAGTSATSPADQFTNTYATNGYDAAITASTTTPAPGASVTLTATANQDMGPTDYGMSIVDVTTNTVLVHIGAGTTATTTVSSATAATHRYVAQIDSINGLPTQAVSTPVIVTWAAPTAPSGPVVTGVSPPSGPAAGGTVVTVTGSGFTAATTVSFGAKAATNVTVTSPTSLTATAPADTRTVDVTVTTTAGTSATSPADQFTNTYATNGYDAAITASTTTPAPGASVTLTATANQDMGPTDYGMSIVDVTTNTVLVHIGAGTTATTTVSSATAATHRYVAQIDSINGLPTQAVSTPVIVTWA